jgi:antitoxin VapB
MALNIKNEEVHRLARELARATGENMTVAVCQAIRERLDRIRESSRKDRVERILEIGRDCAAAHLKEPYKSVDHGELLYDEKGLPK